LGTDYAIACGDDGQGGRAKTLNEEFNEWLALRSGLIVEGPAARHGSVDWLFRTYKASAAYQEKVSARSRLTTSAQCCLSQIL